MLLAVFDLRINQVLLSPAHLHLLLLLLHIRFIEFIILEFSVMCRLENHVGCCHTIDTTINL